MKNLKELARKPQLIEIILDDKDIVESYGDCINFWVYDQVDLNSYFEFFKSQGDGDGKAMETVLQSLVLNEQGQPMLDEGETFPIDLTVAMLGKLGEILGKSRTKSSTPKPGTQPE